MPIQAPQIHCIRLSVTTPLQALACYLCLKRRVSTKHMGQFFEELKRRNVLRLAITYQRSGNPVMCDQETST